ncbi:MAG: hotdog fold thioesterase [Chitinophagaceae bacterium]|jgi:acyl-CoA thioesterase|nr:hotdog fold thioesterase [Chitinophagaceae bacterium]
MSITIEQARHIVELMMEKDAFSQWLGIRVVDIAPGICQLQMTVGEEMCNGFSIAHGGIPFALADSCCSFSVNAHGRKSLSVETSISQFKGIQVGDTLTCESTEESLGKKIGVYTAIITNQDGVRIAIFKGTYYRSDKRWLEPEDQAAGEAAL